jgi:hypothetical protein
MSKKSSHVCLKHGIFGHVGCTVDGVSNSFPQDCPVCDPDRWQLEANEWWYEDEFAAFVLETRESAGIVDTPAPVELE